MTYQNKEKNMKSRFLYASGINSKFFTKLFK